MSPPSHSLRFWVVNPAGRLDNWCIKVTCIDESWLVSSDPLGTASNETSVPRLDPAAEPRGWLVPGRGRVPGRGSLGTPTYYTHLAHIQPWYNPYIGGICWYISGTLQRLLSKGYSPKGTQLFPLIICFSGSINSWYGRWDSSNLENREFLVMGI